MSLSPAFLDELRARTLLSALIAKTVKLQRAGREFRACCPFHNEKSPSFYVNDEKAFYHCFGCGAHGDAIRWMTDQQGLPFIDAVKELAQAANLELPAQDAREAQRAERANSLHDVMAAAAAWFEEQYDGLAGATARAYVEKRGITGETRKAFGLGYAPDSKTALRRALASFGDPMLIEAGLLIQVDDKEPYDRFRDRLMIPIHDPRGRVIAFGGRIIGAGEPKYLNSPDTPLFDKGRTLYNLDRAAPAARKAGRMIVVEGYLDVIALAQAGIDEVVAPLGTALTEFQIERLWRQVDAPLLCFDGDKAGQKAAFRAATRALPGLAPGRSLAFLTLPPGQDPDDVVRHGGREEFERLASASADLPEFVWDTFLGSVNPQSPTDRASLRLKLDGLAATVTDPLVRREYAKTFKDLFFGSFGWKPHDVKTIRRAMAESRDPGRVGAEDRFIRAILLGLGRYPMVLHSELEALSGLRISNAYLDRWRNVMVEAALANPRLDESLIETILSQSDVSPIERYDLSKDLAFSFFQRMAEPERAQNDLIEVIRTLRSERETEIALAGATRRFSETLAEADWLEQQRLLRAKADLELKHSDYVELAQAA